jgi:coenzyme F420-reducing hydrogenase beta subunit
MRKEKKSLAETHPEVAKQWHQTKNGNLTPNDVTSGSSKKIWWKCDKGDDHEWETKICHMTKGSGCPICSNHIAVLSNCLATLNPELSKEWHPKFGRAHV